MSRNKSRSTSRANALSRVILLPFQRLRVQQHRTDDCIPKMSRDDLLVDYPLRACVLRLRGGERSITASTSLDSNQHKIYLCTNADKFSLFPFHPFPAFLASHHRPVLRDAPPIQSTYSAVRNHPRTADAALLFGAQMDGWTLYCRVSIRHGRTLY